MSPRFRLARDRLYRLTADPADANPRPDHREANPIPAPSSAFAFFAAAASSAPRLSSLKHHEQIDHVSLT